MWQFISITIALVKQVLGAPLPHPTPARSFRSLAEDLTQMCPLQDFASPKLKVFRRA